MPADCIGVKRANIAVALAEADRARIVQANNDRIAGSAPVEVPTAALVKAIYLRAQCLVIHSIPCSIQLLRCLLNVADEHLATARSPTRSGNEQRLI